MMQRWAKGVLTCLEISCNVAEACLCGKYNEHCLQRIMFPGLMCVLMAAHPTRFVAKARSANGPSWVF